MRNENLVEWNNFKDDSFGLKIRLQAGDLQPSMRPPGV